MININKFFTEGHRRTILVKKNIVVSFIIKGLNILIGLLFVSLTINYLSITKYGIWITLSSIITWFGFFDIGLGNGLRNRFAEAIAIGKHDLAKTYVSTTYAILTIIIVFILILFYIINPFLNWANILNSGDAVKPSELNDLAKIVFTFFCLQFVFKLITTILTADQRPAIASFFDFFGKLLSLGVIYILTKTTESSLLLLGWSISVIPVIVLLVANIFFFNGKYKRYRPSIKTIDFTKAKDLFNLGINFFIIQISFILIFQTNNIIISHLFGPEEVTPYNVSYKYFSILSMAFSIIISPFWSAFTEAWLKNELLWIKTIINKLIKIWFLLLIIGIIMLSFSKLVYKIWIGNNVIIDSTISFLVFISVLIYTWNSIYSNFINGVGKIKLQLYISIINALLNVPLAILLGKLLGIKGVLLANILIGINAAWIFPMQYNRLIKGKAYGIWNK
jgi:O-antigen/teichoic acid export membrane protein